MVDAFPLAGFWRRGRLVAMTQVDPIPSGIRELYRELENETAWMWVIWSDYKVLFGTEESVQLLNDTAPTCFHEIQRSLKTAAGYHLAKTSGEPAFVAILEAVNYPLRPARGILSGDCCPGLTC
jgi:hypothetical protein